jgi:hypothetical protein
MEIENGRCVCLWFGNDNMGLQWRLIMAHVLSRVMPEGRPPAPTPGKRQPRVAERLFLNVAQALLPLVGLAVEMRGQVQTQLACAGIAGHLGQLSVFVSRIPQSANAFHSPAIAVSWPNAMI